jgi:hypothetical protein
MARKLVHDDDPFDGMEGQPVAVVLEHGGIAYGVITAVVDGFSGEMDITVVWGAPELTFIQEAKYDPTGKALHSWHVIGPKEATP